MIGVRMQLQGACMRREGWRREQCVFLWLFVGIWWSTTTTRINRTFGTSRFLHLRIIFVEGTKVKFLLSCPPPPAADGQKATRGLFQEGIFKHVISPPLCSLLFCSEMPISCTTVVRHWRLPFLGSVTLISDQRNLRNARYSNSSLSWSLLCQEW